MLHLLVKTTDRYWVGQTMHWRIHLTDGRSVEVSDDAIRTWLKSKGEKIDGKISYRKMAKYAMAHVR